MGGEKIVESQHESDGSLRWDMSEVAPSHHEDDSNGTKTENAEIDPSLARREKEEDIHNAREQVKEVFEKMAAKDETIVERSQSQPPEIQKKPIQEYTFGQVIKKTAVVTGNVALVVGAASAIVLAPVSIPLAVPLAVMAADSIVYNMTGVNGSMFEVDGKNRIKQRLNPLPVLLKHRGQNSSEIFQEETRKLFDGLKPGETYNTRSHSMTYALLRRAQSGGRSTALSRENTGKKTRMFLENLVTGNWKAIKSGRKHDMYDISFKVV